MRPTLKRIFFSARRPRVYFHTSNTNKFLQARTIFDLCGLPLTHFRSLNEPYEEHYEQGRLALLKDAIEQIREKIGRRVLFFVEDTSVRIEALSDSSNDVPGLRVKEWFAETSFFTLDRELSKAGDRRARVRSDIALHVPSVQPVYLFAETTGRVAAELLDFDANPEYPWLTPETFNGWFIPVGAERPLGAMSFEESLEYDFRVRSFLKLVDRLAEYTAVLNLPASSYDRLDRVGEENADQVELFESDSVPSRRVIMVVGFTCAGKTEFGKAAEGIDDVRHVEASSVLRDMREADVTDLSPFELAKRILNDLGPDVVARAIMDRVLAFAKEKVIVVTGFRAIEEIAYVRRVSQDSTLVYLDADQRTRYQRQIQRARTGSVSSIHEFAEKDLKQRSFGLLGVAVDLADDVIRNEGTSDRSLERYHQTVKAYLQGIADIPGVSRQAKARVPLPKERLYRCLDALRRAGAPLTAPEMEELTTEEGWGIAQRNINQSLRDYPELVERRRVGGKTFRYELTKAGLAYLRQREYKVAKAQKTEARG